MTVKAIRLENFMAFADTGWIELRPITLLFGRNSSGKSAIIRALRLLRQNLEQPTNERYALRLNSEYGVELGDYEETVHGKGPNRVMRFHFRCDVPMAADAVRNEINQWRQQDDLPVFAPSKKDTLTLALTFGYDAHREAELIGIEVGCSWQLAAEPDTHTLLSAVRLDWETRYELGYEWWLDTDLLAWQSLDWQNTTFKFPRDFLPELEWSPVKALSYALVSLTQSVSVFLKGIEYQPPIRPDPQRIYVLDEVAKQRWRQRGWTAFVAFLEGNKLDGPIEDKIDSWLQALELGDQILPPNWYPGLDAIVSKIVLKEQESEFTVNLKNTGFGASQVIPIIVQSVTARQRVADAAPVCIIIEQPELHLHPGAQAKLADLFIEEIQLARLNWEDLDEHERSKVSFLLETHSEHLLLRFLRRLAETSLRTHKKHPYHRPPLFLNDLSLIYVERNRRISQSNCQAIIVNELGEYEQQPAGFVEFFGEDFSELLAIGDVRAQWTDLGKENDSSM